MWIMTLKTTDVCGSISICASRWSLMFGIRSNAQRKCAYTATSARCVSFATNDSRAFVSFVVFWVIPTNIVKRIFTSRQIRSCISWMTQSGSNHVISSSNWWLSG
ncbi:hypothetical protein LINGRAHAP2_LOCUS20283 [Linum grandiflorum]